MSQMPWEERNARRSARGTPIARLQTIMREAGFTSKDPQFLSWALARGVVTPQWLFEACGQDEVFELAEEIGRETEKYLDWEKTKMVRSRKGKLVEGRTK